MRWTRRAKRLYALWWDNLTFGLMLNDTRTTAITLFTLRCLVCKGFYPRLGWWTIKIHPRCRAIE